MPIEMTMPRLSDTMQQGTIVKWNVKEGQKVKSGDVVADIETDKATMELQTFDDGTVAVLAIPEGRTVPVGTVILILAATGEDAAAIKAARGGAATGAASATARPAPAAVGVGSAQAPATRAESGTAVAERAAGANGARAPADAGAGGRIFASPLARKIASERGVDLATIEGTGPSGRITRRDVEAAAHDAAPRDQGARAPTAPPARPALSAATVPGHAFADDAPALTGRRVALSNMRRTIAARLVESKTTIPHYQVTVEVDMDPLTDLRQRLNEQLAAQGVKLSVNDFLVRACALAMHEHPFVNSRWDESRGDAAIEIIGQVNIGVAVALPEERGGGLVVATIRNADRLGLRQISQQTKSLADKARSKGLTIEEMSDSTFTISNLGMFGVSHFTAIINPPNAAILAVGAAIERPVVRNGQVVPGRVMSMTMSSDHRIVDGAMAARYLATVKDLLEKPATLLV